MRLAGAAALALEAIAGEELQLQCAAHVAASRPG